ncbi:MAG: DUF5320 domain-containing protein [Candidatus Aenigmarchaeota archaeon]|nr:DUF5320 domain-containing protein [Candidatus Aenigmarchaeota archaeon]
MPGGNGTGPAGMGRMTGRGMGYCNGFQAPGFASAGFGRGRGNRFWARNTGLPGWQRANDYQAYPVVQPTKEQEIQYLEEEKEMLKQELESIKQSIKSIESKMMEIKK